MLQRGQLEFALELPNGAPEFRYAYHETIAETHHTLMLQAFVNRSGIDVPGLPRLMRAGARQVVRQVVRLGGRFPELLFVFVLGGEDPIDRVRREMLASGRVRHPLVERLSRIHVVEEARHLSFARASLRRHVPELPARRRLHLAVATPLVLGQMARPMMEPSAAAVAAYEIPRDVGKRVYRRNPAHRGAPPTRCAGWASRAWRSTSRRRPSIGLGVAWAAGRRRSTVAPRGRPPRGGAVRHLPTPTPSSVRDA